MKNAQILEIINEKLNILHTIEWRKSNFIRNITRKNFLFKHEFEGKIEGMGRQGRRDTQLWRDLKETEGYWKLKEEEPDRTV